MGSWFQGISVHHGEGISVHKAYRAALQETAGNTDLGWNLQRPATHDQLPPARAHLLKLHNLKQRYHLGNMQNSATRWGTCIPSKSLWDTSDSNQSIFLKAPKGLLSPHNVKILCIWDGKKKDWTKARPKPSCTTIKSHSSMSRLRNTRWHRQDSKWFGYSHPLAQLPEVDTAALLGCLCLVPTAFLCRFHFWSLQHSGVSFAAWD